MGEREDERVKRHMEILASEALCGGSNILLADLRYLRDELDSEDVEINRLCDRVHELEREIASLTAWIRASCDEWTEHGGTCDGCPIDACPLCLEAP